MHYVQCWYKPLSVQPFYPELMVCHWPDYWVYLMVYNNQWGNGCSFRYIVYNYNYIYIYIYIYTYIYIYIYIYICSCVFYRSMCALLESCITSSYWWTGMVTFCAVQSAQDSPRSGRWGAGADGRTDGRCFAK